MKFLSPVLLLLLAGECQQAPNTFEAEPAGEEIVSPAGDLAFLKLPLGFQIQTFASNIENARGMALGDAGTIFVGSRGAGKVYALVDTDGDFKADKTHVIASKLNMPTGLCFRNGALYVAEVGEVWKFENIEKSLVNPPQKVLVSSKFPEIKHHGWKYLGFGPDGKLYVPVGAPCNICESEDPIFATITRMNADGSDFEIYAKGIRNTVGFDWHPSTGEMWFTDNGRDWLGDDLPPDELNRITKAGQHFGYPYCHGSNISDPEFGNLFSCSQFEPPAKELGPHVAAIGMKFYTGTMFPEKYRNSIFVAEHGSWNRKEPIGYRVMLAEIKGNKVISYTAFVEGWLTSKGDRLGRPADVLVLPDGSLLISDDEADKIYRITYTRPN